MWHAFGIYWSALPDQAIQQMLRTHQMLHLMTAPYFPVFKGCMNRLDDFVELIVALILEMIIGAFNTNTFPSSPASFRSRTSYAEKKELAATTLVPDQRRHRAIFVRLVCVCCFLEPAMAAWSASPRPSVACGISAPVQRRKLRELRETRHRARLTASSTPFSSILRRRLQELRPTHGTGAPSAD